MVLYQVPLDPIESAVCSGQITFGWVFTSGKTKGSIDATCSELYKEYTSSVCVKVDLNKCSSWLESRGYNKEGCCFLVKGRKEMWKGVNPPKPEIRQQMTLAAETRFNPPESKCSQPETKNKPCSI